MTTIESTPFSHVQQKLSRNERSWPRIMPRMESIAERIVQLRESQRLTQEGLAASLGVSRGAVGNWERGQPISRRSVEALASKFGVSADWLLNGEGDTPQLSKPIPIPPGRLPYGGKVSAGYFLLIDDFNQDIGDHLVPPSIPRHPRYPQLTQTAWQVEGDSMDRAGILDGMWAVAADYSEYVDQVGELDNGNYVIVERSRNGGGEIERTVKEVQFARHGMRLVPRSSNPTHKEFFIDLAPEADNDTEQVRILAVVLWVGRDMDPRSRR